MLQAFHHVLDFLLLQDLVEDFGAELHPLFFGDLPDPVLGPHRVVLILLRHGSIMEVEVGNLNQIPRTGQTPLPYQPL